MPPATTILSVLGLEHSGTTLLVRILNNHPDAIAIGGMKNIGDFAASRRPCSCGRERGNCEPWREITRVFGTHGHELAAVFPALEKGDTAVLRDFLLSVRKASGKTLIIESSRQPSYLDFLPAEPEFASLPVHIFKHPGAQAWSAYRAGRSVLREMRRYRRRSRAILKRLVNSKIAVHISHDAFCAAPETQLRRILDRAKMQPDPRQLETWGTNELHIIGGNRMKKETSSAIKSDESWRSLLPIFHRITARILGGGSYRQNIAAMRES